MKRLFVDDVMQVLSSNTEPSLITRIYDKEYLAKPDVRVGYHKMVAGENGCSFDVFVRGVLVIPHLLRRSDGAIVFAKRLDHPRPVGTRSAPFSLSQPSSKVREVTHSDSLWLSISTRCMEHSMVGIVWSGGLPCARRCTSAAQESNDHSTKRNSVQVIR